MEPIREAQNAISKPYYNDGLNALKFWLMPFVCLASFTLMLPYGPLISRFSLFAPVAFYILCGFAAAAKENEENGLYGRLLKRTAKRFFILLGIFLVLNIAFYYFVGALPSVIAAFFNKGPIFSLVALCTWPFQIGETIWFLQALLYARIILWLMDKLKWMRFYKIVMVVTILAMILLGELAGVIHFNFHGYTYIPGNGITRALPYMLLGRFLYEKRKWFFSLRSLLYIFTFLLGIAACVGELALLSRMGCLIYTGHLIGYGIMALSACCFFLKKRRMGNNFAASHGNTYSRRIYMWSQPVGHALLIAVSLLAPQFYGFTQALAGVFVYIICFGIAFAIGYVRFIKRVTKKYQ